MHHDWRRVSLSVCLSPAGVASDRLRFFGPGTVVTLVSAADSLPLPRDPFFPPLLLGQTHRPEPAAAAASFIS